LTFSAYYALITYKNIWCGLCLRHLWHLLKQQSRSLKLTVNKCQLSSLTWTLSPPKAILVHRLLSSGKVWQTIKDRLPTTKSEQTNVILISLQWNTVLPVLNIRILPTLYVFGIFGLYQTKYMYRYMQYLYWYTINFVFGSKYSVSFAVISIIWSAKKKPIFKWSKI